jgi:hypothetical protein
LAIHDVRNGTVLCGYHVHDLERRREIDIRCTRVALLGDTSVFRCGRDRKLFEGCRVLQ